MRHDRDGAQVPAAESSPATTSSWLSQAGEIRHYSVYGLRLASEIQLTFAEGGPSGDPDVSLLVAKPELFMEATRSATVKPNPLGWYEYAELDDGRFYLRWENLFEFLVDSDGRRIWCGWLGATSLESLQVYLLGRALSFALVKQGFEPLHATAVVIDGQAVAFLGHSGFGKSSLAAAFLAAGHHLLTDDLLLLRAGAGAYEAQPGPPRIKLFPPIARRFLATTASGVPMNNLTEKMVLPLTNGQYHEVSAPLRAFYVLAAPREVHRRQRLQITALSPRETVIELVRSTFNHLVTDAPRLQRQYFESLHVALSVPARRISHPRVLAHLPAVREAILSDLAEVRGSVNQFSL
jgi:hypothetical protein